MAIFKTLREITESEELKAITDTTKSVKNNAEKLLSFELSADDSNKREFCKFAADLDQALKNLVGYARKRKSLTSKLDKFIPLFHVFSTGKGIDLCVKCEKALGYEVHEALWQMIMEKEFLRHLSTELCPSENESSSSASSDPQAHRTLSMIEANPVQNVAGFIIRKLEQKFSKKKNQMMFNH